MLSSAERQRRHRRHRLGDHSLCDPDRGCDRSARVDVEPDPVAAAEVPAAPVRKPPGRNRAPEGYEHERGARGEELWAALAPELVKFPAQRVLLDEACRLADRLDRLDYVLADRSAWLTTETDDGGRAIVVVDAALGEARQHSAALKALLVEITKVLPKPKEEPKTSTRKSGGLGDLVALADRRRSSAG